MDGSPSSVISMGWGSWGSTGLTLTLGFGQGAQAAVVMVGPWSDVELISADRGIVVISANRTSVNVSADRQRIEVHS